MAEQSKELKEALLEIEKKIGKNTIMNLSDHAVADVPGIPTGVLSVDLALGGRGIPRGRIIEIYGPESSGKTTLALHAVANAQKLGGVAAFIDVEHALDPSWAKKLGVDLESLLVSQPSNAEEALKIAEMLVKSNAVDIIVIDSVAALVPRAEINGEIGDQHVGLQARLMSQALRILNPLIGRTKTSMIFINQIRMKIGVMFGCFHYNARVTLADGTSRKIGTIVNNREPVEVLSYDPETGNIEPRRVVNWFDNGNADYFLQFEVEGGPSGRRRFAVTPNHLIFTPKGEKRAGELHVGDEVLAQVTDYALTDDQVQLLMGSLLGDGSLRQMGTHSATFRVGHGQAQADYVHWKHQMLQPLSRKIGPVGNGLGFDTYALPALLDLHHEAYAEGGTRIATSSLLERLDAKGLAVWYGDDGSFGGHYERWGNGKAVLYNASLKGEDRERVFEFFERLGIGRPKDFPRGFRFSSEQTARLHELIAPYVHPSVNFKIHPRWRGHFVWKPNPEQSNSAAGLWVEAERIHRAVPARITKIYKKPKTRSMRRFDIEVEGKHTYMVDGVIVHNSPETTSGGQALKFYSSVRMDIRRITSVKSTEKDETVGSRVRVKVVKNKVAPPFRLAEFDLMYDRGASVEGDLLDLAVEDNIIDKSGSWFSYGETRLGQGREKVVQYLRDNPDTMDEIRQKILKHRGLVTETPPAPENNGQPEKTPAKSESKSESSGRKQTASTK